MTELLDGPAEIRPVNMDIIRLEDNPAHLMRRATDVAGVSRDIVMKTAIAIQGRKYVKVEGWQAIAIAHGCAASASGVEEIDGGVRAIGEVRRMSDGTMIATAEGFVGRDEATWYGGELTDKYGNTKILPKRADYAIRAMAQTRAISRACRSAFAHVVVLIDANLSTTPAEEVPDKGFDEPRQQPAKAAPRATGATSTATPAGNGKPFKSKEQLIKLLEKDRVSAEYILREKGVLMDNETLEDFPEDSLPINAEQMNDLLKAVREEVAVRGGDGATGTEGQFEIDQTKPGEPEGWRDIPVPFGKDVGVRFGDLSKEKLWWWCVNWKCERREFKGKWYDPKPEDMKLRAVMDQVRDAYGFKEAKQ